MRSWSQPPRPPPLRARRAGARPLAPTWRTRSIIKSRAAVDVAARRLPRRRIWSSPRSSRVRSLGGWFGRWAGSRELDEASGSYYYYNDATGATRFKSRVNKKREILLYCEEERLRGTALRGGDSVRTIRCGVALCVRPGGPDRSLLRSEEEGPNEGLSYHRSSWISTRSRL